MQVKILDFIYQCILKPEDMFLLGVIARHSCLSITKVNWQLSAESVLWFASVGFLILVEHNLASLQDNTQLLPRPKQLNDHFNENILQQLFRVPYL